MSKQTHWQNVYTTKQTDQVSWYQPSPELSLQLVDDYFAQPYFDNSNLEKPIARVIDVGCGTSFLVDNLLASKSLNFEVTLLDLSSKALEITSERLCELSTRVKFIASDVLSAELPNRYFDIWHDRAALHFLTSKADQLAYVKKVTSSVKKGGIVIISTFAKDGPLKCSGLPVQQYSVDALTHLFNAPDFALLHCCEETHTTPFDTTQKFTHVVFKKLN